jgi:hypothetical protein
MNKILKIYVKKNSKDIEHKRKKICSKFYIFTKLRENTSILIIFLKLVKSRKHFENFIILKIYIFIHFEKLLKIRPKMHSKKEYLF